MEPSENTKTSTAQSGLVANQGQPCELPGRVGCIVFDLEPWPGPDGGFDLMLLTAGIFKGEREMVVDTGDDLCGCLGDLHKLQGPICREGGCVGVTKPYIEWQI